MRKVLWVILILALLFRFYSLESIPSWKWDEGVNLNIAYNLINGRLQIFSINYIFFPHPPLFFLASGFMIKILGYNLYSIRILTAFYGVLTAVLVYYVTKDMFGSRTAMTAGLLYALYPSAIYFSRIGYANNQLVFMSLLSLFTIYRFLKTKSLRWLYASAVLVGLAMITEYTAIAGLAASAYLIWTYDRPRLKSFLILALILPFAILALSVSMSSHDLIFETGLQVKRVALTLFFTGVMLFIIYLMRKWVIEYIRVFISNLEDVTVPVFILISFLALKIPMGEVIPSDELFYRAITYLTSMGLLSVFLIIPLLRSSIKKSVLVSYTTAYFLALFALNRADHMFMLFYPYLIILLALLIEKVHYLIGQFTKEYNINPVILLIFAYHPILFISLQDTELFLVGNAINFTSEGYFSQLVDYINNRTTEDDVVLTYSFLAPYSHAKSCTILQSVAYEGGSVKYYSGDIDQSRFLYNCSYQNAKHIILTQATKDSLKEDIGYENLSNYIQTLEYESVGAFLVYSKDI